MRPELTIALTMVFAGLAGCKAADAQATTGPDQIATGVAGTLTGMPGNQETSTSTTTGTPTPDLPSPTTTPLSEPTPIPEFDFVMSQVLDEGFITQYLASQNQLVDENTSGLEGVSKVSLEAFSDNFQAREQATNEGKPVVGNDFMWAGLSQPVKDIRDRGLDFHKRNGGQGLGFTSDDLSVLRTIDDNDDKISKREGIGHLGKDDNLRVWMIGSANQADKAILDLVKSSMINQGLDPDAPENLGLLQGEFFRIIDELGIIPTGTTGEWWTVTSNGRFDVSCSTYAADAPQRSQQSEASRLLSFYPQQEGLNDGDEDEQVTKLDARDSILVTGVITPDGYLRVEVYTLANTPDPLNKLQDFAEETGVSASGYRWLPCGVSFVSPTSTETPIPGFTPLPSVEITPTPTNTPKPPTPTLKPSATPQGPEPTATPQETKPAGTPTQPVPTGTEPSTPVPTPTNPVNTRTPVAYRPNYVA